MEAASLDRRGVDVQEQRRERSRDVDAAGTEDVAVECLPVLLPEVDDLHVLEPYAGVHADVVEPVVEYSARNGAATVATVPDGDVVEIHSGIVDVEGAADVVGYVGECHPQQAVLEYHVLTRDFQRLGRAVRADLSGQLSAHLAEDVGEEGSGIAEVEALEAGVEPERLVLRDIISSGVHDGGALEGAAEGVVEQAVLKVPRSTERHSTCGMAGYQSGVGGYVDHESQLVLHRRGDHGSSVCYALDTQVLCREGVGYAEVDVVDADHQRVRPVLGDAAVHREVLLAVGDVQPGDLDRSVGIVVGSGVETPLLSSEVDVRGQAPGIDHGLARAAPGEVSGEIQLAPVLGIGHVVVVVSYADVVVVGVEHKGVVLHPDGGGECQLRAGDGAVEGIVPVVELQVHAPHVFVLECEPGRREVARKPAVLSDAHPQGRTVGDICARGEERQKVTAVVEVERDAVGPAVPFAGRLSEQGPDLFLRRDVLDVPGYVPYASVAFVRAVQEVGCQFDAVAAPSRRGGDLKVSDIMQSVGALELEVLGVDATDQVALAETLEIGVEAAKRHAGNLPAVNVEGMQVGISEIGGEPVQGVLRGTGEGREPLEHEA